MSLATAIPHAHAQSSTAPTVGMMPTVAPAAEQHGHDVRSAPARPAPIVAPPGALAGFQRWAAERMTTAKGVSTTCTLGTSADGDEHRPEWSDAYQPTRRQEVEDLGQRIGLEGGWPSFEETFPEATPRESLLLALEFSEGLHAGQRLRARRIGYEVGIDGGPGELPVTVPGRFSLDFLIGWDAGSTDRAERDAIMADHFGRLDFEAAEEERERDMMQLAREAGGWDRVAGRALI